MGDEIDVIRSEVGVGDVEVSYERGEGRSVVDLLFGIDDQSAFFHGGYLRKLEPIDHTSFLSVL